MKKRAVLWCAICAAAFTLVVAGEEARDARIGSDEPKMLPLRIEKQGKRRTEDILRHMGMAKIKNPTSNSHRKRLASASRPRHDKASLPDSHVYVIKLPSNGYYYEKHPQLAAQDRTVNRIPVDFKSNGKPGKIYHWNLPVMRKNAKKHANQVLKWSREEKKAEGRRVSYFRPKKPSEQAFHKYFPGNGKPHSIYVIERSRKKH